MAKHAQVSTFSARGELDDRIHLVEAPADVLIDPSPYRTRCGQRVLEAYNTKVDVTCTVCAGG